MSATHYEDLGVETGPRAAAARFAVLREQRPRAAS